MKNPNPVFLAALLLLLPVVLLAAAAPAKELKLAGLFADHMVLQRETAAPVWGWAAPGEKITVEFAGQEKSATAAADGKWLVKLDAMPASTEPRVLTVTGDHAVKISDVLVGDVWLCSGQSNMGIPMNIPNDYLQRRIREANNPQLRLFQTVHQFPDAPATNTSGAWRVAQTNVVGSWIAIGYIFGDKIQTELGVPVGIIASAMGGTPIESWLPRAVLDANPGSSEQLKNLEAAVATNTTKIARRPSSCFNGKIAPLVPFALKGVLWYQGEGNVHYFEFYPRQITALMHSWRELFGLPQLPFILTELAPFHPPATAPEDSDRARFGEALAGAAKADGHAWVITIVDGGDPDQIHPVKKEIPGERFAAMALAKVYGRPGIAHGPVRESLKIDGDKAVVKFSSVGGGLTVKALKLGKYDVAGDAPHGFELAGADRKFFPATATITGNDTVTVTCPEVAAPVAVRYAWAGFPLCNLFNQEGFAAYPFRTDDWPWPTPEPKPEKKPDAQK